MNLKVKADALVLKNNSVKTSYNNFNTVKYLAAFYENTDIITMIKTSGNQMISQKKKFFFFKFINAARTVL